MKTFEVTVRVRVPEKVSKADVRDGINNALDEDEGGMAWGDWHVGQARLKLVKRGRKDWPKRRMT